jgi:hypothetical protein
MVSPERTDNNVRNPFSKRTLKRVAIGLVLLVAVFLIVNAALAWQAKERLENKRAEIRAAGLPASIADLAPQPIPDEKNAAAILDRIRPQLDAFHKDYNAFCNSAAGTAFFERQDGGQPPTPVQAAALSAVLVPHAELLPAFRRAATCDVYASKLDFTLPHGEFIDAIVNHTQIVRAVGRFIDLQAKQAIATDRADEAAQLGTQLLKLGRLAADEPTLIEYLVSIAIRNIAIDQIINPAMRAGAVDDSILDETRARLAAELDANDRPMLKGALQTEWAIVLDFPADRIPGLPIPAGTSITNFILGEAAALEEAVAVAGRPYFELRDKWAAKQKNQPGQALLMPAIVATFDAEARRLVFVRSMRIVSALTAYQQRFGKEAGSLEDLSLPAGAVVDPYSGKPLILKRTDAGWVVYSVMGNGVDDGGDFTDLKDYGLAPAGYGKN